MLEEFYRSQGAKALASAAREAGGRGDFLLHGTRSPQAVLEGNRLLYSRSGNASVSFSRSPEVAAYWAVLPRGEIDEGHGAIFVLDRRALQTNYRIEPHHDFEESAQFLSDEMEEMVYGRDIDDLGRFLLGVVTSNRRDPVKVVTLRRTSVGA